MTRSEHVEWCKARALEYLDAGDMENALASMMSDMEKHPETRYNPILNQLGFMELMNHNADGIRRWIVGFN